MNTLIVGGSSGLGLSIAKEYADSGDKVIITGRSDPAASFAKFQKFDLTEDELPKRISALVDRLPKIDNFVFSAGLYVDGKVTELSEKTIDDILDISARSLIFFIRSILIKQASLGSLITISSMSQWVPSPTTPVYNYVKAGLGHFSNSLSKDGRIAKVLVVAPATMNSKDGQNPKFADKSWVAKEIAKTMERDFKFKVIKILNDPPRVEVAETR